VVVRNSVKCVQPTEMVLGQFLHLEHVIHCTSIVAFTCTRDFVLGNPTIYIYIPLARPQEEVHFYEAPGNETRQLENWINYKMTVVNIKMDSVFMTLFHLMRRQRSGYWASETCLALWDTFL
jgi:hypothetical protein